MSAPNTYTVGELVADCLYFNGVRTVFGMISVHNLPIMDGIAKRRELRMVMTRGETGAAHMADGCARVGKRLGAVVTSTGPGASNAVPGLVEARFANTPLLHITGQTLTQYVDRNQGTVHDIPDQLGMLRSVSKAAFRIRSVQEALPILKQAILLANTAPCGPVSVEIPIDIQRSQAHRRYAEHEFRAPQPQLQQPVDTDLDRLAELVLNAKRPMLRIGRGALGATAEVSELLEMGFGLTTSWGGRGVVSEEHPQNLGSLNGVGIPIVEALYEEVDLMLVVGSGIRSAETLDMKVKLPARLVQIDIEPQADGRTYPTQHFICGEAAAALSGLIHRIKGRMNVDQSFVQKFKQVKIEARAEFAKSLGPYETFSAQLREAMPKDVIFARDITLSNSTWGYRLFPMHSPRENVYPASSGLGQGVQLAIGSALEAGSKVVTLTGDGGFFFNLAELWTAVQEKLEIVFIVMNDSGYGVIKHMQTAMFEGRHQFVDLAGPDLMGLAKLAGMPGWRVTEADKFGATVAQAMQVKGPSIVEVDMHAVGAFPPYYPHSEMIAKSQHSSATRVQSGEEARS
ncbi:thiamine pyrophosphate-binding protein [Ottowia caeni]|uniref:thiamine pyrophosphate-binding protein n=1 Tax=Ottowia caeni TaxID=2870339 RepID=UPI003D73503E|nr:thiamine pyrophosphate-binding protein [Ottowia caeni]